MILILILYSFSVFAEGITNDESIQIFREELNADIRNNIKSSSTGGGTSFESGGSSSGGGGGGSSSGGGSYGGSGGIIGPIEAVQTVDAVIPKGENAANADAFASISTK